jgi:hypothetical protein
LPDIAKKHRKEKEKEKIKKMDQLGNYKTSVIKKLLFILVFPH